MTITKSDEEHIQFLILTGIEKGMEKGMNDLKESQKESLESQKEGLKSQRNFMLIILTIFLGVSGPLTVWVANQQSRIEAKVDSDEAYRNFLTKNQYYALDNDEHRYDIRAIADPKNCHSIYEEHSRSVGENLEIKTRSAQQIDKK